MNIVKEAKETLLQYNNHIRNRNDLTENNLLRGFIALLASQYIPLQFNQREVSLAEIFHNFDASFFTENNVDTFSMFNIDNNDVFLKNILLTFSHEKLSNDQLINILEWINTDYQSGKLANPITPKDLADLLIEIADIKSTDTIFDPSMGSGSLLLALRKKHTQPLFTGIEINKKAFYIASLQKKLLDDNSTLINSNTLYQLIGERTKYDIIISNPPVLKLSKDIIYGRLSSHLPYIAPEESINFINLSLDHLNNNSKAIFLVTLSCLVVANLQEYRKKWVNSDLLKTVITLPNNLLPNTGTRCALLIFEKVDDDKGSTIKFINAEDCFTKDRRKNVLTENNIKEILNRLKNVNDEKVCKSISKEEIEKNNYQLIPYHYLSQKIVGINFNLSKQWDSLENLTTIIQGNFLSQLPSGREPIIKGRNIRTNKLNLEELECKDFTEYKGEIQRTQQYDILIQRISGKPAAYLIKELDETGVAIDNTLFLIRFNEINEEFIKFIALYLNSDEAINRISSMCEGYVIPTLSKKILNSIQIPVPDINIISLINEMYEIEQNLYQEYENATQLRKSIFGNPGEKNISTNLDKIRLTSFTLRNALNQKDDLLYKIRTLYPFPIAYPYKTIYSAKEKADLYNRQMKYGEHLLSFLASIGMSLVIFYKNQLTTSTEELFQELNEGISKGMSPGDWRSLLHKSCSLLRTLPNEPLSNMFSSIWFKGSGQKESQLARMARENLTEPLNDFKHSRGPLNPYEYNEYAEKQKETILQILEQIEFLCQYDFILINDVDNIWSNKETVYTGDLLKGDHPVFEGIKFSTDKKLTKNKIYIRYKKEFICLYPFINFAYNPHTRKEEIFSFDKEKKGKLELKSFESGTTIHISELKDDLLSLIED